MFQSMFSIILCISHTNHFLRYALRIRETTGFLSQIVHRMCEAICELETTAADWAAMCASQARNPRLRTVNPTNLPPR